MSIRPQNDGYSEDPHEALRPASETGLIVVLVHSLAGGGAQRSSYLLALELQRHHENVVFATIYPDGAYSESFGASVRHVSFCNHRSRRLPRINAALRTIQGVRRLHAEVVISNSFPSSEVLLLARSLRIIRSRIIYVIHNDARYEATVEFRTKTVQRVWRRIKRLIIRFATKIVAVSQGAADTAEEWLSLKPGQIHVIHNAVPAEWVSPIEEIRLPLRDLHPEGAIQRPLILAAGRLERQKNFPLLLEAFARLPAGRRGTLIIAGEGPLRTDLERQIVRLGLEEEILLPGFIAEVKSAFLECDLFVSTSSWEGFGRVHLEAAALGTPVLSTDCPSGPSEIAALMPGRLTLVPVNDVDAMAAGLKNFTELYHTGDAPQWPPYIPHELSSEFMTERYLRLIRK